MTFLSRRTILSLRRMPVLFILTDSNSVASGCKRDHAPVARYRPVRGGQTTTM